MKKLLLILFVLFSYAATAQEASLLSLKEIGGDGVTEIVPQVTKTADGGFIIAISDNSDSGTGNIDSFCAMSGTKGIFVKYNSDASIQEWSKCYLLGIGDTGLQYMYPQSDGGILFGGEYLSGLGWGFYICRQDSLGSIVWSHGYSEGNSPLLFDMIPTADGGYMMMGLVYFTDSNFTIHNSGSGNADIGVMKLDSLGNKQWSKAIGGSDDEKAAKAISIPGGGYYIFGATMSDDGDCTGSHGAADAYLARLDNAGNIIWHKDMGGTGPDGGGGQNSGYACADGKGGIIVATISSSDNGDVTHQIDTTGSNIWLLDVDSNSNITWNNCYGGSGVEYPTSVCMATDSSIWIAGQSQYAGGEIDTSYGGNSDAWIVHADNTGNFINAKVLGSTGQDAGEMIYPLSNGSVITGGYYEYSNGSFNESWGAFAAFLAILSPSTESVTQVQASNNGIKIYPNPANDYITIESKDNGPFIITNVIGEIIYRSVINDKTQIQVDDWQAGVYYVQVISEYGYKEVQKFIVQ